MRKLVALVSLLLALAPVMAFGGPDGTIDTYFSAEGIMPVFHSSLVLNGGDDFVNEKVWVGMGEVIVVENIDLEDNKLFCFEWADANLDKAITVDPWFGYAHVEEMAVWDGVGEVYREAWLGDDIYSEVDASTLLGDAMFIDNIEYKGEVNVYKSVGLNRFATCDPVTTPDPVPFPECGWC